MDDYIAALESQFSRLSIMETNIQESMRVEILLCLLSSLSESASVIASINTLQVDAATWNYVSMLFIEEQKK